LTIQSHARILDTIEAYFGLSPEMFALSVKATWRGEDATERLSLSAAREALTDPGFPIDSRDAIWSQLIQNARAQKEPWELALFWMMIPGLRKACGRSRRYAANMDSAELQAEAVAGLVEALHTADPHRQELESWLWWTTYRRLQRASARWRSETPAADIELIDSYRARRYDATRSETPTPRSVAATLPNPNQTRPLNSRSVEGQRLGALAHRLGLQHTVTKTPRQIPEQAA
jgi:hypothetical protein